MNGALEAQNARIQPASAAFIFDAQAIPAEPHYFHQTNTPSSFVARHLLGLTLAIGTLIVPSLFSQQAGTGSKQGTKKAAPKRNRKAQEPKAEPPASVANRALDELLNVNREASALQATFDDRLTQAFETYVRTSGYVDQDIYPPGDPSTIRLYVAQRNFVAWAASAKDDFPDKRVTALREVVPALTPMQKRLQAALQAAEQAVAKVPARSGGKGDAVPSRTSLEGKLKELGEVTRQLVRWYELWPAPPLFQSVGEEREILNLKYFYIIWKSLGKGQYMVTQYEVRVTQGQESATVEAKLKILDPEGAYADALRSANKTMPLPPGIPSNAVIWTKSDTAPSLADFLNSLGSLAEVLKGTPYAGGIFPRDRGAEKSDGEGGASGSRNGIAEFLQMTELKPFIANLWKWFPTYLTNDDFLRFLTKLYAADSTAPAKADHTKITAAVFGAMTRLWPLSQLDSTLPVRERFLAVAVKSASTLFARYPQDVQAVIYTLGEMRTPASGLRSRAFAPPSETSPNSNANIEGLAQKILDEIKKLVTPTTTPEAPRPKPQALLHRSV